MKKISFSKGYNLQGNERDANTRDDWKGRRGERTNNVIIIIIILLDGYLFVLLEIAKPGERAVAELAGVRGCRVAPVGVHSDVGVDLWLRRETGRRRGRARRGRLAASPRVWSAILALPRRASGPQRLCNLNRERLSFSVRRWEKMERDIGRFFFS